MSLPNSQRRALPARHAFVVACAAASLPAAQAQQPAPQEVTVTATRVPTRLADVVADITVLGRAELERAEARTLPELLSQQAGLQFAANGGLGKTATLFIRGLEARHTLLLVDGVRVGSATVGTPSLDNLPLESIERIEIVRGPLSSLYGNGAMGGVIQVFTRKAPQGLTGNAKLALGSGRFGQMAAGLGLGSGPFDAAVQVQRTTARPGSVSNSRVPFGAYNADEDGFGQTAGSLRLGWSVAGDWRLELTALESRGVTALDDGPGADARARMDNRVAALAVRGTVRPGWTARVSLGDSTDVYETLATASAFTPLGATQTRSRQAAWENTLATPLGSLLLLAERTTERVARPGAPYSVSERDIDALATGLSGSAQGHSWQASLRRDRNSQFGGVTTGALAYAFAFSPALRLGASFGTSQTLPSFNQLYFPNFGNPGLLPEEGRHTEVHLRWAEGPHSLRAAVYGHRYRNFISSGPQPANLPRAEVDGFSLGYAALWRGVDLQASFDHTEPTNATQGSANFGKWLPRRARDALRLSADAPLGAWTIGASLAAFSGRFDDAANNARLPGYATLDLRATLALARDLSLGLRLNNVADARYETVLGYNQPGRQGVVSLRYALR